MATERKTVMISARLPASLVARVDFVARNTEGEIKNRSGAVQAALEDWLPGHEFEIRKRLGTPPPKKA